VIPARSRRATWSTGSSPSQAPNRLGFTDITEHPTAEGKLYRAAVMDAWSRRIVGWSIAPQIRTELVLDALDMATARRTPKNGEQFCTAITDRNTRPGPSGNA
jgi:transposase InsO family protein